MQPKDFYNLKIGQTLYEGLEPHDIIGLKDDKDSTGKEIMFSDVKVWIRWISICDAVALKAPTTITASQLRSAWDKLCRKDKSVSVTKLIKELGLEK